MSKQRLFSTLDAHHNVPTGILLEFDPDNGLAELYIYNSQPAQEMTRESIKFDLQSIRNERVYLFVYATLADHDLIIQVINQLDQRLVGTVICCPDVSPYQNIPSIVAWENKNLPRDYQLAVEMLLAEPVDMQSVDYPEAETAETIAINEPFDMVQIEAQERARSRSIQQNPFDFTV